MLFLASVNNLPPFHHAKRPWDEERLHQRLCPRAHCFSPLSGRRAQGGPTITSARVLSPSVLRLMRHVVLFPSMRRSCRSSRQAAEIRPRREINASDPLTILFRHPHRGPHRADLPPAGLALLQFQTGYPRWDELGQKGRWGFHSPVFSIVSPLQLSTPSARHSHFHKPDEFERWSRPESQSQSLLAVF